MKCPKCNSDNPDGSIFCGKCGARLGEVGLKKTELDTPALWVDLVQLEENIALLSACFRKAAINWRPHMKGIRSPAIAHKLIAAGAIGITCAKLGEAEVMVAAGIEDILIANQVVGTRKYARVAELKRHADVKIAVDSEATLSDLGKAALSKGVEIGIVVELDTGMGRAGIQPGKPAQELSLLVHDTPGLHYLGLMTWEGHAVWIDNPDSKRKEIEKSIKELRDSAELCRQAGLPVSIVSCGGSGTYTITSQLAGITEIQAGGAIFCDVTYQKWGVKTKPALFVRSTVTSRPTSDRIIFDAGFKTMPAWFNPPRPIGISNIKSIVMSAEHGVLTLEKPNDSVKVDDIFDFIPGYGDMTVFLHDYLYGIRENIVEEIWGIG